MNLNSRTHVNTHSLWKSGPWTHTHTHTSPSPPIVIVSLYSILNKHISVVQAVVVWESASEHCRNTWLWFHWRITTHERRMSPCRDSRTLQAQKKRSEGFSLMLLTCRKHGCDLFHGLILLVYFMTSICIVFKKATFPLLKKTGKINGKQPLETELNKSKIFPPWTQECCGIKDHVQALSEKQFIFFCIASPWLSKILFRNSKMYITNITSVMCSVIGKFI